MAIKAIVTATAVVDAAEQQTSRGSIKQCGGGGAGGEAAADVLVVVCEDCNVCVLSTCAQGAHEQRERESARDRIGIWTSACQNGAALGYLLTHSLTYFFLSLYLLFRGEPSIAAAIVSRQTPSSCLPSFLIPRLSAQISQPTNIYLCCACDDDDDEVVMRARVCIYVYTSVFESGWAEKW